MDAPVDDQVAAGAEGAGTELADVIPLVWGAEETRDQERIQARDVLGCALGGQL